MKAINVASLGSGWVKLHPESLEGFRKYYIIPTIEAWFAP